MNPLAYILNAWDKIANVSDKAAIKIVVALVIIALLFNSNRQKDEKDNTIANLRTDLKTEKSEHKETKLLLLDCHNSSNERILKESIAKDSTIARLTRANEMKK